MVQSSPASSSDPQPPDDQLSSQRFHGIAKKKLVLIASIVVFLLVVGGMGLTVALKSDATNDAASSPSSSTTQTASASSAPTSNPSGPYQDDKYRAPTYEQLITGFPKTLNLAPLTAVLGGMSSDSPVCTGNMGGIVNCSFTMENKQFGLGLSFYYGRDAADAGSTFTMFRKTTMQEASSMYDVKDLPGVGKAAFTHCREATMNSTDIQLFALDANLVVQVKVGNNDARSWADAAEQKKILDAMVTFTTATLTSLAAG